LLRYLGHDANPSETEKSAVNGKLKSGA
jgi:hypothetical protein